MNGLNHVTRPISPPLVMPQVKNHQALQAPTGLLRDQDHSPELEVATQTSDVLTSRELATRYLQLEEASLMKSALLANMSHELRTPLNAIIGFSELLDDGSLGELSAQQKEAVNDIFTSGNHLLALINDILDLSKVEAGKMTLELDALQVATLVRAGLQSVREVTLTRKLRVVPKIAEGLGSIWLDGRKVKQILYNLLSNAVKFTPDGGEITVTARHVVRQALPDGPFEPCFELAVSDTGIGISAVDQARLFQPFTRIDSPLARRYEGTGHGLAMVKQLAQIHGGEVALESTPKKGSTFTVWIPWRAAEDPPAEHDPLPAAVLGQEPPAVFAAGAANPGARLPLALVVEDDDTAAELLRLQLERSGFRVVRSRTGEAALEQAKLECPDLITVDIPLPDTDGWAFIEGFKQHPRFAGVPVVIASSDADKVRGLSVGASYVMEQPVGREALARALAACGFPPVVDAERGTVLVVDDDPKAVKLLATYLQSTGYRILTACSWQDGIDLARSKLPDLIVLDLMMPEVNGFEVVQVLKRDTATSGIPIVIVTAKQVTAEDRARLGADVLKVIEKSDLNQGRLVREVTLAMTERKA